MAIEKALSCGLAGDKISKQITGTSEVSVGRTTVATGAGVVTGAVAAGVLEVGLASIGFAAAAPITVPLAVASGAIACVASLFDWD